MKPETEKLLAIIDKDLDEVKSACYRYFGGDEGHDIGDASSALELLCNTCFPADDQETEMHDTYTYYQMRDFLAEKLMVSKAEFRRVCDDIDSWDEDTLYARLGRKKA